MKRVLSFVLVAIMCLLLFSSCEPKCQHSFIPATCTTYATCSKCGETRGTPMEHIWEEATCTTPKSCTICSATRGEKLEHTFTEATYSSPKTCTVCGITEGSALIKPEEKVVGIYQMSYLNNNRTITESLQFYSNGTVVHKCSANYDDAYGNWTVSDSVITFSLGYDHYTATVVDGGIMWESSFLKKIY